MYGYYGYYGVLGTIFWILFWIVIIAIIIRLIRGPRWRDGMYYRHDRHGWGGTNTKDAVDVLKERYAKGEINKQEFEEKKADLMKM